MKTRACAIGGLAVVVMAAAGNAEPASPPGPEGAQGAKGRELFLRHWLANDPRGRGGDGLGPLYNATSCVNCHRQGGHGGAGTADRNVNVVTLRPRILITPSDPSSPRNLDDFHPGFRTANSVVLHQYSTDPGYRAWRLRRVDGVEHADMAETGGDAERDMVRETVLKGDPALPSSGRKPLDPLGPRPRNRVARDRAPRSGRVPDPAEHPGPVRRRADRRDPGRVAGAGRAGRRPEDPRAAEPVQRRPGRPVRVEGPDRVAEGLRDVGLRRGDRVGSPRAPPGAAAPRLRREGAGEARPGRGRL